MRSEESQMFLLCLNWVRLLLVGLVFFTLLVVFFSAGFFLGSRSDHYDGVSVSPTSGSGGRNVFIPSIHAQGNPVNPVPGEGGSLLSPTMLGEGAIELGRKNASPKRRLSALQEGEPIVSSSRLLQEDRGDYIRRQRQGKPAVLQAERKASPRQNPSKPSKKPNPTPSELGSGVRYYVQVLTTSNRQRAAFITRQLRKEGFRAALHSKRLRDLVLYRIRVGLYAEKSEAVRDLRRIRSKKNLQNAFMRTYIPSKASVPN